jgi:hypothetical protein
MVQIFQKKLKLISKAVHHKMAQLRQYKCKNVNGSRVKKRRDKQVPSFFIDSKMPLNGNLLPGSTEQKSIYTKL